MTSAPVEHAHRLRWSVISRRSVQDQSNCLPCNLPESLGNRGNHTNFLFYTNLVKDEIIDNGFSEEVHMKSGRLQKAFLLLFSNQASGMSQFQPS